jgi:hypothetical protein
VSTNAVSEGRKPHRPTHGTLVLHALAPSHPNPTSCTLSRANQCKQHPPPPFNSPAPPPPPPHTPTHHANLRDGRFGYEIKLTGELSTNAVSEGEDPEHPTHGTLVLHSLAPLSLISPHAHFFTQLKPDTSQPPPPFTPLRHPHPTPTHTCRTAASAMKSS